MTSDRRALLLPVLAACFGIALFSLMDGFMKTLSIALGAYNAMLWRTITGTLLGGGAYAATRPVRPSMASLRMHLWRGFIVLVMALGFFWGIARVPLAEGIALSFIAPLVALYLAAILLKEHVGRAAIIASLLGLAGVVVIMAGRIGGERYDPDALMGMSAILISALFYAYNLILQRQQALIAGPVEIALFQNIAIAGMLLLAAPWFAVIPEPSLWYAVAGAASLAFGAQMALSWAYARAEAQHLLPIEYTAFIWAAIVGWLAFDEAITIATLGGTLLIVAGCLIAARAKPASAAPAHIEETVF